MKASYRASCSATDPPCNLQSSRAVNHGTPISNAAQCQLVTGSAHEARLTELGDNSRAPVRMIDPTSLSQCTKPYGVD